MWTAPLDCRKIYRSQFDCVWSRAAAGAVLLYALVLDVFRFLLRDEDFLLGSRDKMSVCWAQTCAIAMCSIPSAREGSHRPVNFTDSIDEARLSSRNARVDAGVLEVGIPRTTLYPQRRSCLDFKRE